ncbi:hypothetical protein [Lactococcus garvieae]|uniref:hypothetical protein n=1 Tax=Lactococcus garvieae TaxID=1363 RepID=UPI003853356A
MRYNEKSIYESRCLYSECREVITVTAKSEVAAKELFAKFGSTNHPKLSIPKKIADALDKLEFDWDMMAFPNSPQGDYQDLFDYIDRGNAPIIMTYLAGKALGVELVEVEG